MATVKSWSIPIHILGFNKFQIRCEIVRIMSINPRKVTESNMLRRAFMSRNVSINLTGKNRANSVQECGFESHIDIKCLFNYYDETLFGMSQQGL